MMKLYRFLFLTFVIVCGAGFHEASAQSVKVTGQVISSDDGTTMPGVSILERGTSNGTASDSDGKFSITVDANSVLVFSFVGYTPQEVSVMGRQTINVSLEPSVSALNEIVVIGYGQVERKDVAGSIQTISAKDFNKGVISAPQDLLTGKVAGVQITSGGGAPGEGSVIRIRGGASLNASNDPLIVVDGVPLDNAAVGGTANFLAMLNPNDIDNINVLKDASSTAIYGSRASNGVIIITTKKGSAGKMKLQYNGNFSLSTPISFTDVLNGDEYRDLIKRLNDEGFSGIDNTVVNLLGTENTDWQKQIYRNAFSHDHNIVASGSVKNLPYRVSYGYTDEQGILKNTDVKRHSVNVNLNPNLLNDKLRINANVKASVSKNNFGNRGAIGSAVAFDPTKPVRDDSFSNYGGYWSWLQPSGLPVSGATGNPVAMINQTDNRSDVNRFIGTLQADYDLFDGLTATVIGSYDYSESEGKNYEFENAAWSFGGPGRKVDYTSVNTSKLLDAYLTYKRLLDRHSVTLTAGYSYQNFQREGTNFERNWAETSFQVADFSENGTRIPLDNVSSPLYLVSLFGRLNYSFDDRYIFYLTVRNDASSRFSKDLRSQIFPSVAFAWNVMNEQFMENTNSLSNLKFRASWGVTGQQDIGGVYPYLPQYTKSTATANYQFGNNFYTTYRPNAYDANIKWEETETINAGLDIGFLNDRFTASIDLYQRNTKDLINFIPVAAGSNLSNYLLTNVGSMKNSGIEVALNYALVQGSDFNWTLGVNFTHNKNEITKLTTVDDPNYIGVLTGGIAGGVGNTVQNHQVGYPASSFFVFKQIYDANGNPIEGLYEDVSGKGGDITGSDQNRIRYHQPVPLYTAGINSSINYKAIDFSFSGRLSLDNYVYNNGRADRSRYDNLYYAQGYMMNAPKDISEVNFSKAQYLSSYFVENASFFKMDYISVGYTPKSIMNDKLKARIGFTVRNAFTITKYSGLDPEVHGGIDNNLYPRPRIYMLSLNLTY